MRQHQSSISRGTAILVLLAFVASPAQAERRPARPLGIIATVGPASTSAPVLQAMLHHTELTGLRLNMAHTRRPAAMLLGRNIRRAAAAEGRKVDVLCDLPGGKMRTGAEPDGGSVELREGQRFTLKYGCRSAASTSESGTVDYPRLGSYAQVGGKVELHQGKIALEITNLSPGEIETRVLRGGVLRGHATVNLVGKDPAFPNVTPLDRRKLKIAVDSGATHIGVSMVQRPEQMRAVRKALGRLGAANVKLVSKIETLSALRQNLKGIVAESDEVMIARGDLEMSLRDEFLARFGREPTELERKEALHSAERTIARVCRAAGKPFINATGFEGPDAQQELARARRLGSSRILLKTTSLDPDPVGVVQRTLRHIR